LVGAAFSEYAGDIIAQTLAMEGAFAFFLESAFVGLFLWGEDRFG
jgi:cytochrome bd ubiquinol oxidase subunit I